MRRNGHPETEKISEILFRFGILFSVLGGMIIIFSSLSSDMNVGAGHIAGLCVLTLGSLLSWLSNLLLYKNDSIHNNDTNKNNTNDHRGM